MSQWSPEAPSFVRIVDRTIDIGRYGLVGAAGGAGIGEAVSSGLLPAAIGALIGAGVCIKIGLRAQSREYESPIGRGIFHP